MEGGSERDGEGGEVDLAVGERCYEGLACLSVILWD